MDNFDRYKLESISVALVTATKPQKWVQVYFAQQISFWESTTLNCKGRGHWRPLKRVYWLL